MGCCASTNKSTLPLKTAHITDSKTTKHAALSKSPPPTHPLHEEETVKEVVSSETPTAPKPLSPPIPKFQSPFINSAPLLTHKERRNGVILFPTFAASDDLSEASEICSTLSESVSASASVTERRESGGDGRAAELRELCHRSPARVRNRAFSGEMLREKRVGRSPGPSPGRARPAPVSGYGRRRENNGESSERRSRSPATRVESGSGLGRAQSARRTGKSPGRIGAGSVERIRKLEGSDNKCPPPTDASNESLENPFMSLECFIFL